MGVAVAFHLRPIVHFRATLVAQNPSARCPTSRRGSQLPKPRRPLELFPGLESLRQRTRPAPAPQEATPESLWQQCLQLIRDNVPAQAFKTWFEPLKPLRWEKNTLTVQVPSQFFCEWLEEHYYGLLQQVLLRVLGPHARLEYEVVLERGDELQQRAVRLPAFRTPPVQPTLPLSLTPPPPHIPITPINPRFTFESFVCGASNQLAYTAARSVAEQPGKTRFNPLLLYGGVGLGKTHLAQAINNYLLRRNVPLRLIYVSSEYFTTGYITALQQNRAHEFTAFYNSADVLIIDDVQFLAGKEKTQAHFFHIFNTLYQAGKQLVFTSDKSPRELTELDERLVSRLQWGLVAEILPPDFELRLAILRRKSADEGLQLPEEVLEYIAHAVTGSVRELEGCLIHLLARATLDRCEITLELAQHAVAALVGQGNPSAADPPPALTLERIAREVADYYGIPLEALRGKSRKHDIAQARHLAMYLARMLLDLPLKHIGHYFGGRDHTTVMHGCSAIERALPHSSALRQALQELQQRLRPARP